MKNLHPELFCEKRAQAVDSRLRRTVRRWDIIYHS